MAIISSITLFVLAVLIGAIVALYAGFHSSLREIAMLFGLGGWPGRVATVHLFFWLATLYVVGPPPDGWLLYGVISLVVVGTVAAPFSLNNHRCLRTITSHSEPVTHPDGANTEGELLPVTGAVVIDEDVVDGDASLDIDAVVAPFTAQRCAAFEWAVKRKQWLTRRTTYTTIDSGEEAGAFVLDTEHGYIGVAPQDPTLLLVSGVGLTGYETATRNPSSAGEIGDTANSRFGAIYDDMRYCETTLKAGETATVVGPVSNGTRGPEDHLVISDADGGSLFIIDDDFYRIKHFVTRYLKWTPHISGIGLSLGWLYVGWVRIFGL